MWGYWIFAAIVLLFGFVVFRGAPYVPSHRKEVERAFDDLYKVGPSDLVVDVGSGDGIILRLAAQRGAHAVGYELNPALVVIARFLSRKNKHVAVYLSDFWFARLPSQTTLIYAFAVERDIEKLARKIQTEANRLEKTLHVITYGSSFHSIQPVEELGAHHLFIFHPLQRNKP
jgi:SAM-dependent methyltransferase